MASDGPTASPEDFDTLDRLLSGIIKDNREKVSGWMAGEAGCWGFLAGKAVAACRAQTKRPLTGQERRLVWHRLWWWLEQGTGRVLG